MRRLLLFVSVVLIAACGSDKSTGPQLVLTLSGPSTVQGFQDTISAQPVYQCDFTLTATASGGSPGDAGTWTGGHDIFLHQDGTSTAHVLQASDVADLVGASAEIPGGTAVRGNDYFYTQTDRPFQLSMVFYYSTPEASIDSTTYHMACQ